MSKKIINGDVNLSGIWIDELPDFLAVNELQGNLIIDQHPYPSLRSLKNSPILVNGDVRVNSTNITNLEGAPQMVLRNFELDSNTRLNSLKGAPQYVAGNFSIQFSEGLRSLDHGWSEKVQVGRNFELHYSGEMGQFKREDILKYYDVDPGNIFINDAYEDMHMYDLEDDLDARDYFNDR